MGRFKVVALALAVTSMASAWAGSLKIETGVGLIRDAIAEKKGTLTRPRPSAALRERLDSDTDIGISFMENCTVAASIVRRCPFRNGRANGGFSSLMVQGLF